MIKNFGATAVRVETEPQFGGFAWYLDNWTDTLRSNSVFGIQRGHFPDAIPQSTALTDRVITGHAASRVQFSAQYLF